MIIDYGVEIYCQSNAFEIVLAKFDYRMSTELTTTPQHIHDISRQTKKKTFRI